MGALALLLPLVEGVIKKLFPDPQAQADAQLKLAQMVQNGELAQLAADAEIAKGQLAVNLAEATKERWLMTWREAFGWICVLIIGFKYIGGPLLYVAAQFVGHPITQPQIDATELWPPLLGMLGLGLQNAVPKK